MHALLYILLTSVKNWILELRHKPSKLLLYLLCIVGMLGFLIPQMFSSPSSVNPQTDIIWLKGAYFVMASFFLVVAVRKGLSNGDSIFEMQDVNLLFVSPVNPKSILLYGLTQMIKSAFLAGFFILFMSNAIFQIFGKGFSATLILFFCFMLTTILLSIISLVLYSLTNSHPRRKLLVKLLTACIYVPIVIIFVLEILKTKELFAALEHTLHSSVFSWTPIAGWSSESAIAFIGGAMEKGLLFSFLTVLVSIILVLYIWLSKIDYYEDVLVATETSFEKKRAISEGQVNPEALLSSKIKVAKTGIAGVGAATFFYKHLRESTRASKLGLLSVTNIVMIIGFSIFALFMRNQGGTGMLILEILMWMQIFMIGMGRGLKETMMHYIYMVPISSFQKILWSNMEPVAQVLLESILLFGIVGILGNESILTTIGCISTFTLFSLMLISINYLSMRWFGTELGNGILIMVYIIAVMLSLAPGLVAGILLGTTIGGTAGTAIGLAVLSLWELLVALGSFWLSRSVLHNCDIQVVNK